MCWMPTKYRHQLNMIMFWIHLLQMDYERMVKKVYNECKSLTDNHNQKNWAWEVKSILLNVGYSYSLGGTRVHVMDSHMERQNMWLPAVSSTYRGRIGNLTL